jgi:hypothetical protein
VSLAELPVVGTVADRAALTTAVLSAFPSVTVGVMSGGHESGVLLADALIEESFTESLRGRSVGDQGMPRHAYHRAQPASVKEAAALSAYSGLIDAIYVISPTPEASLQLPAPARRSGPTVSVLLCAADTPRSDRLPLPGECKY